MRIKVTVYGKIEYYKDGSVEGLSDMGLGFPLWSSILAVASKTQEITTHFFPLLFLTLKTVSSNSCKSKLIKKKGFDFGVSRSVHSFPKPKWLKISHVYPYPFDHLFNVGPLIITLSHHSKTFKQTSLCVSKPQSTHSFFFKKKGKQNK